MFSSHKLVTDYSQCLRLPVSHFIHKDAWEKAQTHSNAIARQNAFLNYISLYTMINWFTDEEAEPEANIDQPTIYPGEDSLSSIWELVNGAAIALGEKKIVIIPCDIEDSEEFIVPQEWVDIAEWAGDYYLCVQVKTEEDECSIEVYGFTTHRYLKSVGDYNANDRTYKLALNSLAENLAIMKIAFPLQMRTEIPELPKLSEFEAEKLLEVFSNSSIYTPRLRVKDMSFEQWAGFIVNQHWRQQLYEGRIGKLAPSPDLARNFTIKLEKLVTKCTRKYR